MFSTQVEFRNCCRVGLQICGHRVAYYAKIQQKTFSIFAALNAMVRAQNRCKTCTKIKGAGSLLFSKILAGFVVIINKVCETRANVKVFRHT